MRWPSRPAATACARQWQSRVQAPSRQFASAPSQRPRGRFGPAVSLEHFLQRAKVLGLWRRVLRDTRRIADPATREETRRMAREEFERSRAVDDIAQIKYLVSTGKSQWDAMERYIDGL